MRNDYLFPIINEIPVIKYKITSKTYKATKYNFMWAQNTLDDERQSSLDKTRKQWVAIIDKHHHMHFFTFKTVLV